MSKHDDPVDAVILAFLDYLEGAAQRPTLDHLGGDDRKRAEELMDSLEAARGIDPHASRPSIEALLAGTPLSGLLAAENTVPVGAANLLTIRNILAGIDERALVDLETDGADGATVVYSFLDLRARFILVDADTPVVTDEIRALVEKLFAGDADTVRVGVVAAGSDDLATQVLSADDVGDTITTPRGEPHIRWEPLLPLDLAARRMVEQSVPEWESFDFDDTLIERLDVAALAAEIAARVIAREAARPYRGDKARAYKALAGRERVFADIVARISARGADVVDLDAETTRIAREAA